MAILGIRAAPKEIRYALVDSDGQTARFLNAEGENRLKFPRGMENPEEKLSWFYGELERIHRQNPAIERIIVKSNEYNRRGSESTASRQAAYLDAVVLTFAGKRAIPVSLKLYAGLGTRRDAVEAFAEENVGRCQTSWNEQMADAVAAAWSGIAE